MTPSLYGSACANLLLPAPAKMDRAAALVNAVVSQRYRDVLLTGAQAALQRPHEFYLILPPGVHQAWDPKRHAVHADRQLWVTLSIEHPLRNTLTNVYGTRWPDSTTPPAPNRFNQRFNRGELPPWIMGKLRSWALSIATVQERLAERLKIPIHQIEQEMPYIYEPRRNVAYWLVDDAGGPADPYPVSLGLDFHRAFYTELKSLEPDLAAELEGQENAEMRHESLTGRHHRFSATGPLGAYLKKTGRRMTLKVSEFEALNSQLVEKARAYERANPSSERVHGGQTEADRIFGNYDLSSLQLRAFMSWIDKVRTSATIAPSTASATASMSPATEIVPVLSLPDKVEQIPLVNPTMQSAEGLQIKSKADQVP